METERHKLIENVAKLESENLGLRTNYEELVRQIESGDAKIYNLESECKDMRSSLRVTNNVATELQDCLDKIRSLEGDITLKENALRTQKQNYEEIVADVKSQKNALLEEVEILKDNGRH